LTSHYGSGPQPVRSSLPRSGTTRNGTAIGRTSALPHNVRYGDTGSSNHGGNNHNGGNYNNHGNGNHNGGNHNGGNNNHGNRNHNGYRRGYNGYLYSGYGFPYGGYFGPIYNPWLFYPWLDADLSWDFWHDTGDSDDAIAAASVGADAYSAPQDQAADDASSNVADNSPPQSDGENDAQLQNDSDRPIGSAVQADSSNPGMTLVYKNGEQQLIDNYVVSPSTIIITDRAGRITTIPTSALNIVATNQANAALGNGLVLAAR
jgi:hypothetical protein